MQEAGLATQIKNGFRGTGMTPDLLRPEDDVSAVSALLALCPKHGKTPTVTAPELAKKCGVRELFIKDERGRMGLGSFKALGAAFVIARDAARLSDDGTVLADALEGKTYVAASAGNHGLSVAAGAALFGARSVIYLSQAVPEAFAARLRQKGAEVVRAGATYEESMDAAMQAADEHGWTLLSDSSWPGYMDEPHGVMEGYLQLAHEAAKQMPEVTDFVLLQAGVGGLAAAVAAHFRSVWGDGPIIIVVEPSAAPALFESIRAGNLVTTEGPVSNMGRLDCKTPSLIALGALSKDADEFATISEEEAEEGAAILSDHGLATTPSGGAGIAALMAGLDGPGPQSSVLAILSEGPEDA